MEVSLRIIFLAAFLMLTNTALLSAAPAQSRAPQCQEKKCQKEIRKKAAKSGKCYWLYTNGSYVYVCQ